MRTAMSGRAEGPESSGLDGQAAVQAARWVVRLSGAEVGEAEWLAFAAWLDAAPRDRPDLHREAFDRAQAMWFSLDQLSDEPPSHAPRRLRQVPAQRGRRRTLTWAAAAAVAAGVVGLCLWTAAHIPVRGPARASALLAYATAAGQARTLHLADGSLIDMDGATALTVDMGGADRRVALDRGEARFDVVHDPARPFQVDLGEARVRVLGTAFDVVREDGAAEVSVARGAVSLQTAAQSVRLPAGRSARLDAHGGIELAPVSPADVGAWRDGRRLYRDRPLSEVVADLNRQYPQPIRLADAQARRLRFTGVLAPGPRDQTVRRLTLLLPLGAEAGPGGEIVLSSRRKP